MKWSVTIFSRPTRLGDISRNEKKAGAKTDTERRKKQVLLVACL